MSATPLHEALEIPLPEAARPSLLAVVGGGGKTTLLFALAAERAAARGAAASAVSVLTTTTKFTIPAVGEDLPTVLATNPIVRGAAIAEARGRGLATVLVAAGRGERGRLLGVEAEWPSQALGIEGVTFVGVEADGSAGRPFKAPALHEPVMPAGATHVAAVVGVETLGKPLEARFVQRPERVMALTGAKAGEEMTAELIAVVLAHPQGGRKGMLAHGEGGRKGLPPSHSERASFAVVVTRAGRDGAGARAIGEACRAAGIGRVVAYDARAGLVALL